MNDNKKEKVKKVKDNSDRLEVIGIVTECLPQTQFKVELENGVTILAHISGRLRTNKILIIKGDKVKVEMSPYDLTKGRISYRLRG